jgi:hypothetical protein
MGGATMRGEWSEGQQQQVFNQTVLMPAVNDTVQVGIWLRFFLS